MLVKNQYGRIKLYHPSANTVPAKTITMLFEVDDISLLLVYHSIREYALCEFMIKEGILVQVEGEFEIGCLFNSTSFYVNQERNNEKWEDFYAF